MTAEERARALHASLFAHRSSAEKEIAALTAALASARRDALSDAVAAVWAVKDRRGVISIETLVLVQDIADTIEALTKAPDNG